MNSPTLSLCIRTGLEHNLIPVQRNFNSVGLARTQFAKNEHLTILSRTIAFGLEYRFETTMEHLLKLLPKSDALEIWTVLDIVHATFGRDLEPVDRLLNSLEKRHESLRARWHQLYRAKIRTNQLLDLRHVIEDEDQRRVLGLLLNAQSLERLCDGISDLFGRPSDKSGILTFTNLVNEMGYRNGSPNMEAVITGFGLSDQEPLTFRTILESRDITGQETPSSLRENLALGCFVT